MTESKSLLEIYSNWRKKKRFERSIRNANKLHYMTGHRYWVFEQAGGTYSQPMRKRQLEQALRVTPLILKDGRVIKSFDYVLFTKLAAYYTK